MAQEETPRELSSDDEFDAVLDISVELLNSGHFEVRSSSGGISIVVDDEKLTQTAEQHGFLVKSYQSILDHELDVLLTACILDISEDFLFNASPLSGANEEQRHIILGRRERVRALFPIARFAAETLAKRSCVTATLDSMDWQVVSGSDSVAPIVLLSIASSRQTNAFPSSNSGSADLRSLFAPLDRALVGCTLSDVKYLIRSLETVKAKLEAEEAQADGTD